MYSYYGSIAVGTPPVAFDVILDTGSADLWLVDAQCTEGCDGLQAFSPSSSSTFTNDTKPFSVTYGSGQAAGYLATDVVQMAGFSVQNQVFGVFSPASPLLCTLFNGDPFRRMRPGLRRPVDCTCIGAHGPRLAITVVVRRQATLAGPVRRQRLG
jgi:hypothetical protein